VLAAVAGDRGDLGLARPATPPPGVGPTPGPNRIVDGLVLAAPRGAVVDPEVARLPGDLLGRAVAADGFAEALTELLGLLDDGRVAAAGRPVEVPPAVAARDAQLWLHGSTPGGIAQLAGRLGLRFGASYHSQPWAVPEAVAAYRAAFQPSRALAAPHVIVSADVVVAETEARARELAAGYPEWVLGIRTGRGAPPYPAPGDEPHEWTDAERLLVQDRLDTRFVGTPEQVVERLETLQRVTGADELVVTTITHEPAARRDSDRLLADAWGLAAPTA
jgi:luciferase family oxidoreductase group 1